MASSLQPTLFIYIYERFLSLSPSLSVTRFGDILPLWQNCTSLSNFLTVYFLFGKMLSLLCQTCHTIGLIFIVANGQIKKKNSTIWSHWSQSPSVRPFSREWSCSNCDSRSALLFLFHPSSSSAVRPDWAIF